MARHRFRSQPSLQRSSGPTVPAVAALSLIAAIGVGGGVLVGRFLETLPAAPVSAHNAGPADRVATSAPAVSAQTLDAPAAAPQTAAVEAPTEPAAPAPPVVKIKTKPSTRAARPAHVASLPTVRQPTAQEQWEQQRIDYEIARSAYDASERQEGFRWAQRNNVRVPRYCRAAAQPASFVEGCMSYLRPGRSKAAETPPTPDESRGSDEG
jgi:hypothetical protein